MPRLLAAALCLSSLAMAQVIPTPGGYFVFTDTNPPAVSAYDPASGQTTLLTNMPSMISPAGCLVTDQRDVVFCDFNSLAVTRVDLLGNVTPIGMCNNTPVRVVQDHNGDFILTGFATGSWAGTPGGSGSALIRMDSSGTPSIIAFLPGNPYGVLVRPDGTGDRGPYLVTVILQGLLLEVDAGGTVATIAMNLAGPTGVALFPNGDYAVVLSTTRQVVRIPRGGGTPTVFVPNTMLGNVRDIFADGEGGFYVTEGGGAVGSRISHIDPAGGVTTVLGSAAFGTLASAAISSNFVGVVGPGTGFPAGQFGLSLDFPQNGGASYATFVSGSLFPGIPLAGNDPRGTPLNPDPLFVQTFLTGIPGYTINWLGNLSGSGTAAVLIDLTLLSPGALAGTRVYLQTALLDPMAPSGLLRLSHPVTLAFN